MPLYSTMFQSSWVRICSKHIHRVKQGTHKNTHRHSPTQKRVRAVISAPINAAFVCLNYSYLKNGDNSPKQGVKVLPVRHSVPRFCLQAKLTAKYVHPQDAATQTRVLSCNYLFQSQILSQSENAIILLNWML